MKKILLCLILFCATTRATTVTSRVAASTDDAYTLSGGTIDSTAGTVYVGLYYGASAAVGGFRFLGITIPQGATINSASVSGRQVYSVGEAQDSSGTVTVRIKGELATSPVTFSTYADFTARTQTTAQSAAWTIPNGQPNNTPFTSVSCVTVIQEIVNQGGWASGNPLVLFLNNDGSTQHRRIRSWNDDAANCLLLTIDYTVGGGQPAASTEYIRGGVTLRSGVTIR
jgi:hypothetical protein